MKRWSTFWFAAWLVMTLIYASCHLRHKVAGAEEHLSADNMLLRAVLQEADGEPFDGKVAVAGVVFDRVEDPRWPDTITGVLEQPYQFEGLTAPIRDQWRRNVADARDAIAAAQAGLRPCGTVLWFHYRGMIPHDWDYSRIEIACVIGDHVFYKDKE